MKCNAMSTIRHCENEYARVYWMETTEGVLVLLYRK